MSSKIRIDRLSPETSPGIGIGPANTESTAILNISSSTQGILIPRMTTAERDAISSPAAGLLIYNTTLNAIQTYNGSTVSWNTVGAGGGSSDRVRQIMVGDTGASTLGTAFRVVGDKFIWVHSRNSSYVTSTLIYRVAYTDRSLVLRVVNTTTGAVLATSSTISATGTYTLAVTKPTADAILEIQIRATSSGGTGPKVEAAALELDV